VSLLRTPQALFMDWQLFCLLICCADRVGLLLSPRAHFMSWLFLALQAPFHEWAAFSAAGAF
jgi:hypothetical protein